jgi:hypothetical protein
MKQTGYGLNRSLLIGGYKGAHRGLSEVGDVVDGIWCGCAAWLLLVSKCPQLVHNRATTLSSGETTWHLTPKNTHSAGPFLCR